MPITLATAIFGGGYPLFEPSGVSEDVRCVCFTDQKVTRPSRWEIVPVRTKLSARRANRQFKLLLHRYVAGPSLYIDAYFEVVDFRKTRHWLEGAAGHSVAATEHPDRNCLYDEAAFCLRKRCTDNSKRLKRQVERYDKVGMPREFGLWACGVLYRRGDAVAESFGEAWWKEVKVRSERDQVSAPYVAWRQSIEIGSLEGTYRQVPGVRFRKTRKRK